jgi:hypothetical protein
MTRKDPMLLPDARQQAWLAAFIVALSACGTEPRIATTINLNTTSLSFMALGDTRQLTPSVTDQQGDPLDDASVTWSSGDAAVATVSSSGLVTAQGSGSTEVTATAGSASAVAEVTVSQTPAQLNKIIGDGQSGIAGQTLEPFVVEVRDAGENPVAGVKVVFGIAQGRGRVEPSVVTTTADGRASTRLTTGRVVGEAQGVSAGIASTSLSVLFTATTTTGPPATISLAAGNNQHAGAGTQVPVRPAVVVRDAYDNIVAGVPVEFEVLSGGGRVSGPTAVTDAAGRAEVGSWTLGPADPNQLRATAGGTGINWNPVTFIASTARRPYNIELRFLSAVSPSQAEAITRAEQKWESLIVGDVGDEVMNEGPGSCRGDEPAINERVDDVLIFVTLESIDGPHGILGSAAPCWLRVPGFLPLVGLMVFDAADVDLLEREGLLEAAFLHEMAHVLGIGSTWSYLGLLADPAAAGGIDPHFTGRRAITGFNNAGGAGYTGAKVPVENAYGQGTNDSHWRESVFGNELMTGFIDDGTNPLSAITVTSLADLGYEVDLSGADPYSLSSALRLFGTRRTIPLGNDIIRLPIRTVNSSGRETGRIRP